MANDSKMPSDDDTPPPCSSSENSDTTRDTLDYHSPPSEFSSLPTPTVSPSRDNEAISSSRSTSENRPTPEHYPSMITSSFGFSPDIQSRGRVPRRHDGVADPQPTPLLTPLTRINPPNPTQASLSTFHDPAHDQNMGAFAARQQMRAAESTVVQEFMTECFFLLRRTDLTSLQLCQLTILSNVHQLLRNHPSACQSDWLGNTSTIERLRIMAVDRIRYLGIRTLYQFRIQWRRWRKKKKMV